MKSRSVSTSGVALFLLAGCGVLAGCSSDDAKKRPAPAGPASSAPEAPAGPTVSLRARVEGERAVVDVLARGAGEVHGVAFRLHWDPAKLGFIEARGSDVWSKQAVLLAKEGSPGELVVVWTERGNGSGPKAADETVLGSLDFTTKVPEQAALAFRPERSTLRDSKGAPIAVEWRGVEIGKR